MNTPLTLRLAWLDEPAAPHTPVPSPDPCQAAVNIAVAWVCRQVARRPGHHTLRTFEAEHPQLRLLEEAMEQACRTGDARQVEAAGKAWCRAWQGILVGGLLMLAGCATPSTLLVGPTGQLARCAAAGSGVLGMATAVQIHEACVRDFHRLGYVALPPVRLGVRLAPGTQIIEGFGAEGPVPGLALGDEVLQVGTHRLRTMTDAYRALDGAQPGDTVSVLVRRGAQEVTVPVRVLARDRPAD